MSKQVLFIGFGQIANYLFENHIKLGHDVKVFDPRIMSGCNLGKFTGQRKPLVYYTSAAQTRLMDSDNENDLQVFNVEKPRHLFNILTSEFNSGELIYFNTCHIYKNRYVTNKTSIDPISKYAETKLETELYLQSNRGDWSVKSVVLFPSISPLQKNNVVQRLLNTMIMKNKVATNERQSFCISHAKDMAEAIFKIVAGPDLLSRVNLDLGTKFDADDFLDFVKTNKTLLSNRADKNGLFIDLDHKIEPYLLEKRVAKKTKDELFKSFLVADVSQ